MWSDRKVSMQLCDSKNYVRIIYMSCNFGLADCFLSVQQCCGLIWSCGFYLAFVAVNVKSTKAINRLIARSFPPPQYFLPGVLLISDLIFNSLVYLCFCV